MNGPGGVNVNGQFTRNPGIYGDPEFRQGSTNVALAKRLAVLGSFPYLPQATPVEVVSQSSLERLAPSDLDLKRISKIIYSPSSDDLIAGAPASVLLVNVRDSVRSFLQVKNGSSQLLFTLYSAAYGSAGGRTGFGLTRSGSDYPYSYAIEVTRDGVSEPFSSTSYKLLTVTYDNSGGVFDDVVLAYDPEGYLTITGSADAEAVGTWTVGEVCTGKLTITPSGAPGAGESFTATISGVRADGSITDEVLTWSGTDNAAQDSVNWASVTQVVFAKTAGAASETFAASFKIYQRSALQRPTLATVAVEIEAASAKLTASAHADLGSSVFLNEMDKLAATDCTSALSLDNTVRAILSALDGSAMVTYAQDTTGYPGVTVGSTAVDSFLSGGTDGDGESTAGYTAALAALEQYDVQIVVPMSESEAVHTAVRAHCVKMAGVGANERFAWVGQAKDLELTGTSGLQGYIQRLGTRHVGMFGQEIRVYSPLGPAEWLSPKYGALLMAAMQAGAPIPRPITKKYVNVIDVRQKSTWDPNTDREAALGVGLTFIERSIRGLRVCRALTTYGASPDPARTEVSANESVNTCVRGVRIALTDFLADEADGSEEARIKTATREALRALVASKVIASFVDSSITAEQDGDLWIVGFDFTPSYPTNFILIRPRVVQKVVSVNPFAAIAA